MQALAAVLGGTQSLHTNGRTKRWRCLPRKAPRIALRTQQIIAYETGVADTVDPTGRLLRRGMTEPIEAGAIELLTASNSLGGTLAAIEGGFIQREIQDAAYRAAGRRQRPGRRRGRIHSFQQIERVRAGTRRTGDSDWRTAIVGVRAAAAHGDNLVPPIVAAVQAHATLGEIADTADLRRVSRVWRLSMWA